MAQSAGKKLGNIVIWVLMGLLILGLTGFGITSFGSSISAVGTVGDEPVPVNEYYRELVSEIAAEERDTGRQLSISDAEQAGILARVRTRLTNRAALDNAATNMGLSVGDERVREQVVSAQAFQGIDGNFDRAAYQGVLRNRGMSVAEFETGVRKDTARTILQGAVVGGVPAPKVQIDTLMTYFGERRSFRWATFGTDQLAEPLPEPSEEELTAYYQANTPDFTLPQMKRITYAWVLPEMLVETVEIDEDAIARLYESRAAEFQQPERRLVERLIFPTEEAAAEAKAQLDDGSATFQSIVEARGLTLEDVDLGELTQSDLPGAAGEAVFALTEPGVAGPFETDLGPALFRMNGILSAVNIPLEEARADLVEELAQERARRVISDMEIDVEDRLAEGATLEELAEETELVVDQIDWWEASGEMIAGYNAFRDAALTLTQDDFPTVIRLEDGGIFAMRLDEILEPRLQELDEVRGKVLAGWEAQETEKRLRVQAADLQAQVEAGAALSASAAPVDEANAQTREAHIEGTPPALITTAFELEEGGLAILEGFGNVYLLQLTKVEAPDAEDERVGLLTQLLTQQAAQSLSVDLYSAFAGAMAQQAGVEFDNGALSQVHAQIATQ
ncbi:peptidyl-prolyl cis-trans isomerase [Vannielia litorea]|uniref:peptidyl-prolyl cis-trans isomerase n=1 Tax=Vannielia litorea TaxID=1217970 RepID=UPI001C95E850|nr:peptidyl-prolyl cis-trans isomerase [Vannielia litorea]MBY6047738.1 peptidyl-prolyl cis-trans isomerase [Vannielia litorea]MBY6075152.1 peptidyl-prolyl cis-trans isomerase [Vannielia litorea]MBY6152325.1 peptidyl-prolyl cis-trans isomerase [Vannielia litorea]